MSDDSGKGGLRLARLANTLTCHHLISNKEIKNITLFKGNLQTFLKRFSKYSYTKISR